MRGSLAVLGEPAFRRLYLSTAVSSLGSGVAIVALAFAILEATDSATVLGLVIAGRQLAASGMTLAAGVWADRLPRHRVLAGAAAVQALAQGGTAALVLLGGPGALELVGLQVLYGLASGFVVPARTGLVPEVVSAERLQEGNALLHVVEHGGEIAGPALGGVLVALGDAGAALAVDAASFLVAALLLARLRLPPLPRAPRERFLRELAAGVVAFRERRWLWTSSIGFGIGNLAFTSYFVLGPTISRDDYGGATFWAVMGTAFSAGTVLGGLVALRLRPPWPFAACVLAASVGVLQLVVLAVRAPLVVAAGASVVAGIGIAVHLALWYTTFQREIPAHLQSRVASLEATGSFAINPLGSALAAPLALAIGIDATLWLCIALMVASDVGILLVRDAWRAGRVVDASAPG